MLDTPDPVLQLVDEGSRAWHAGRGSWEGTANVNSRSIGIECVGWGYLHHALPPMPPCPPARRALERMLGVGRRATEWAGARGWPAPPRVWVPFPAEQTAHLRELSQDIVKRYEIEASRMVGHGDVDPGRKVDPGPLFPWRMLAEAGVGAWPTETSQPIEMEAPQGTSVPWLQTGLADWGYRVPQTGKLDPQTRDVLTAFQMHYRPSRHDGQLDEDCMRRLQLLLHHRRRREHGAHLRAEKRTDARSAARQQQGLA